MARGIAKTISMLVQLHDCIVDDWDTDHSSFTLFANLRMRGRWPKYCRTDATRGQNATRIMRGVSRLLRQACAGTMLIRNPGDRDPLDGYVTECTVTAPKAIYEREGRGRKVRVGYESGQFRIDLRILGWDYDLEKD